MANGKPGDSPISDMLVHGKHPFPTDIEAMIREIAAIDVEALWSLQWEPFDWERGEKLDDARERLRAILGGLKGVS
jgi:hypothetical protein